MLLRCALRRSARGPLRALRDTSEASSGKTACQSSIRRRFAFFPTVCCTWRASTANRCTWRYPGTGCRVPGSLFPAVRSANVACGLNFVVPYRVRVADAVQSQYNSYGFVASRTSAARRQARRASAAAAATADAATTEAWNDWPGTSLKLLLLNFQSAVACLAGDHPGAEGRARRRASPSCRGGVAATSRKVSLSTSEQRMDPSRDPFRLPGSSRVSPCDKRPVPNLGATFSRPPPASLVPTLLPLPSSAALSPSASSLPLLYTSTLPHSHVCSWSLSPPCPLLPPSLI